MFANSCPSRLGISPIKPSLIMHPTRYEWWLITKLSVFLLVPQKVGGSHPAGQHTRSGLHLRTICSQAFSICIYKYACLCMHAHTLANWAKRNLLKWCPLIFLRVIAIVPAWHIFQWLFAGVFFFAFFLKIVSHMGKRNHLSSYIIFFVERLQAFLSTGAPQIVSTVPTTPNDLDHHPWG